MNAFEVGKLEPHKPRRPPTPAQWAVIVLVVLITLRLLGVGFLENHDALVKPGMPSLDALMTDVQTSVLFRNGNFPT